MANIEQIKGSDGTGNANVATVQSSRAPGATTIDVDTVLGINPAGFCGSMGTPHTFIDPVTSEEITVISEATAVDFTGHVDGSNLEINTIAPGYVDAGNSVGDIIIIRPTTQYADNLAAMIKALYPIGSIYSSTVSTNPATLFGFGTWVAFAAGRVLVGVGTSDQAFAAAATGGESNHVLTTPEMPAHTHQQLLGGTVHNYNIAGGAGIGGDANNSLTTSTGGGGAHNNLQPYVVVYMWNRTA